MDTEKNITLITMTPEKFVEYLGKAIEKSREEFLQEKNEQTYITEKEVMSRFGYSKKELDLRVKRRVFKKYKDGNKKVFYNINDIVKNIENNRIR